MSDPKRKAEKAEKEAAKQAAIDFIKKDLPKFQEWPKIGRLNRDIIITEKIDGTNAAIGILEIKVDRPAIEGVREAFVESYWKVYAQSRTRIITTLDDNAGFAQWVERNSQVLIDTLGPGLHFGEWWGVGIQRGYDLSERRFSLFNTAKWTKPEEAAKLEQARKDGVAIYTVPVLYNGPWTGILGYIDGTQPLDEKDTTLPWLKLDADQKWPEVEGSENPRPRFASNFIMEWLKRIGSQAAPGFMQPEGIVVYHRGSDALFKATVENDEKHKFEV